MIDVSPKFNTLRYARAEGRIKASEDTIQRVKDKTVPKGDVLEISRGAGISAAKRTSDWIVFCHPLPLDWVDLKFELKKDLIIVTAEARAIYKTGVEMEALTAVSAALLNMYDMLKPIDEGMEILNTRLVEKKGGKSNFRDVLERPLKIAVFVISDSASAGKRQDKSGKIICKFLENQSLSISLFEILPDEINILADRFEKAAVEEKMDLIISTGGTGLGPKDMTPEAVRRIIDYEVPGIAEAIRKHGKERTPYAMLSREVVGRKGDCLIITLPGSSRGSKESLQSLFPGLLHAFDMMWGGGHNH